MGVYCVSPVCGHLLQPPPSPPQDTHAQGLGLAPQVFLLGQVRNGMWPGPERRWGFGAELKDTQQPSPGESLLTAEENPSPGRLWRETDPASSPPRGRLWEGGRDRDPASSPHLSYDV